MNSSPFDMVRSLNPRNTYEMVRRNVQDVQKQLLADGWRFGKDWMRKGSSRVLFHPDAMTVHDLKTKTTRLINSDVFAAQTTRSLASMAGVSAKPKTQRVKASKGKKSYVRSKARK